MSAGMKLQMLLAQDPAECNCAELGEFETCDACKRLMANQAAAYEQRPVICARCERICPANQTVVEDIDTSLFGDCPQVRRVCFECVENNL